MGVLVRFYALIFYTVWFLSFEVFAQQRSPRAVHPVTYMHQLPTGEAPGWFGTYWFDLEISQANIWNIPMTVLNTENNRLLTYEADFEQTTYSFRNGFQLNEDFAFTVELPYAVRSGGFLDPTIENVHVAIGSQRFLREDYPQGRAAFRISDQGQTVLDEGSGAGLSSVVLGLKYWPVKWSNSGCPCGIGIGLQSSLPVPSSPRGFYSGGVNTSASLHLGAPLGEDGGLWLTGSLTYAPENQYLESWPRQKYLQVYDGNLDIPLGGGVGFFFQVRVESPLMKREKLEFVDNSADRYSYQVNRMSSAYHSLVLWRTYETFGLRFRFGENSILRLGVLEDGGLGSYDETGSPMYVNNNPDVMGVLQLSLPID